VAVVRRPRGLLRTRRKLCAQARVAVSTVGPYALLGEPKVKVCSEAGTDYGDLTGDVQWIRRLMQRYEITAWKSGARIVQRSNALSGQAYGADFRFDEAMLAGRSLMAKITGDRDPGCGSTAKTLAEGAACRLTNANGPEILGVV